MRQGNGKLRSKLLNPNGDGSGALTSRHPTSVESFAVANGSVEVINSFLLVC
jgi:hypothetical protein